MLQQASSLMSAGDDHILSSIQVLTMMRMLVMPVVMIMTIMMMSIGSP